MWNETLPLSRENGVIGVKRFSLILFGSVQKTI